MTFKNNKNNFNRMARFALALLPMLSLMGCASGAMSTNMSPPDILAYTKHPYSVSVMVGAGEETSAIGGSKISNEELQAAIADAIKNSRVFRSIIKDGKSDYRLDVAITKLTQPFFGINFTVDLSALWTLTSVDTNKVVFREEITTAFTATMGDSVLGVKRLRLANEGAARENIKTGIIKISNVAIAKGASRDEARSAPPPAGVFAQQPRTAAPPAVLSDAEALNKMALNYAKGDGVQQDYAKACEYWRMAGHHHNNANAQYALGTMYAEGKGVSKDMKEALSWWSKAANQGNAAAQNNLGVLYAEGSVVPKDMKEAASWWTKAAKQGNVAAKENLKGMQAEKSDLFG